MVAATSREGTRTATTGPREGAPRSRTAAFAAHVTPRVIAPGADPIARQTTPPHTATARRSPERGPPRSPPDARTIPSMRAQAREPSMIRPAPRRSGGQTPDPSHRLAVHDPSLLPQAKSDRGDHIRQSSSTATTCPFDSRATTLLLHISDLHVRARANTSTSRQTAAARLGDGVRSP